MDVAINLSCFHAHAKGAIIYPRSTLGASSFYLLKQKDAALHQLLSISYKADMMALEQT